MRATSGNYTLTDNERYCIETMGIEARKCRWRRLNRRLYCDNMDLAVRILGLVAIGLLIGLC